ncbi:hypothetical protein [Haliangium sp.]|uniref:hypothetical protein n=1 Tax=Haliangium sp. TaxID=2663208 RepID=UPI003D12061F
MDHSHPCELWISRNCSMAIVRLNEDRYCDLHTFLVDIVQHEAQPMRTLHERPGVGAAGERRCEVYRLGARWGVAEFDGDRMRFDMPGDGRSRRRLWFRRLDVDESPVARDLGVVLRALITPLLPPAARLGRGKRASTAG